MSDLMALGAGALLSLGAVAFVWLFSKLEEDRS